MGIEALTVLAAVLIFSLGAGVVYLLLHRLKRRHGAGNARLDSLADTLMEKLESRPLSDEQKAKISEAIRGLRSPSSE